MTRECHVRFCERLGVRLPRPTYQSRANQVSPVCPQALAALARPLAGPGMQCGVPSAGFGLWVRWKTEHGTHSITPLPQLFIRKIICLGPKIVIGNLG